jgi:hypothetical protein
LLKLFHIVDGFYNFISLVAQTPGIARKAGNGSLNDFFGAGWLEKIRQPVNQKSDYDYKNKSQ